MTALPRNLAAAVDRLQAAMTEADPEAAGLVLCRDGAELLTVDAGGALEEALVGRLTDALVEVVNRLVPEPSP
ncbi:MAG: hypothetical protein WD341_06265 [Tistlia sp.]|uniref:hypothetical protein n=1 Tax=Tistlia sp. TaxID=3057121 RepID=UPI0034A5C31E